MRKHPAPAERKLRQLLRDRQLDDFKFRRQHRIVDYIADFYCHEVGLVIELDGESHGERTEYDAKRTRRIRRAGCDVIRSENDDVFRFTDAVLEEIWRECDARRNGGGIGAKPSP